MRILTMLAVASAIGVASVPAQSASVTYSNFYPTNNNIDPAQNPQSFVVTDWNGASQSVSLPKFNSSLGTLTGVDLALYGNINTSGTVSNDGNAPVDIASYQALLDITLLKPGTPVPATDTFTSGLLTVSPTQVNVPSNTTLAPGQGYDFGTGTPVNASDHGAVSLTDFAPYVGDGNVVFPLFAATTTNTEDNGGGDLTLSQTTTARALASITYSYDLPGVDVPEPKSVAMLGAGLLGLGLLRRRT